jgi:hypothetical protein
VNCFVIAGGATAFGLRQSSGAFDLRARLKAAEDCRTPRRQAHDGIYLQIEAEVKS